MQAVYCGGFIYAIGGQDHKQRILRDAERYSLLTGTWEHLGNLSAARAGLAVCVLDQRIWIVGGYNHKTGTVADVAETYDTVNHR